MPSVSHTNLLIKQHCSHIFGAEMRHFLGHPGHAAERMSSQGRVLTRCVISVKTGV